MIQDFSETKFLERVVEVQLGPESFIRGELEGGAREESHGVLKKAWYSLLGKEKEEKKEKEKKEKKGARETIRSRLLPGRATVTTGKFMARQAPVESPTPQTSQPDVFLEQTTGAAGQTTQGQVHPEGGSSAPSSDTTAWNTAIQPEFWLHSSVVQEILRNIPTPAGMLRRDFESLESLRIIRLLVGHLVTA